MAKPPLLAQGSPWTRKARASAPGHGLRSSSPNLDAMKLFHSISHPCYFCPWEFMVRLYLSYLNWQFDLVLQDSWHTSRKQCHWESQVTPVLINISSDTHLIALTITKNFSQKCFWMFLTCGFQTSRNPTHLKFLCSRPCTFTTIQMSHGQNEIIWHQEQYVSGRFQPFSTRVNSHEELDLGLPKNESSNGLSLRKDLEIDPLTAISMRTQSPKNKNESKTMSSRLRWSCSCRSFCRTLAALPGWTIRQHSTLRHGLSDALGDNDGYWDDKRWMMGLGPKIDLGPVVWGQAQHQASVHGKVLQTSSCCGIVLFCT